MDTITKLFRLALAVIGLHIADDNFIHPEPGTSAGDHLVSGLVPLALLALVACAYPRMRAAGRGVTALILSPLAVATGVEAVHYTTQTAPSGDDFTGFLAIPAGLLLLGIGGLTLWRERRTDGSHARRFGRRALLAVALFASVTVFVVPMGVAYVTTHTARAVVPENELGVPYENVSFTTTDGLELKGWYVPSHNGAAVISFPGRSGTQDQARMLAEHGYGVLLFDPRGEGESEGDPNSFGWGGDRDIKAAIAYLRLRDDVDPGRIGGIGRSVGGELMLETASETDALKAVVSEGAGHRALSDAADLPESGALFVAGMAAKVGAMSVLANQAPPPNLKDVVHRIAPRPVMFIAAPNTANGEKLNRGYHAAAREPKTLWEIPESKHVGGMDARPAEYERRVVGFFDRALLR